MTPCRPSCLAAMAAAILAGFQLARAAPPLGAVHLDLAPSSDAVSISLDYLPTGGGGRLRGVLALVAGDKTSGAEMLAEKPWADFARFHGFILASVTFASKADDKNAVRGFYDASSDSGEIVATALKRLGAGRVPVFMYGFSGGAHFAASFVEHYPQLLKGWCAASFEFEDDKSELAADDAEGRRPPGIVACGSEDLDFSASLSYYVRGRNAGRKWTWIEIDGLNHERSPALEDFTRRYFALLHHKKLGPGLWKDVGNDLKTWLPDEELFADWSKLNAPKREGVIKSIVKTNHKDLDQLAVFLRLPPRNPIPGVLCLNMLADSPAEVNERLSSGKTGAGDRLLEFAAARGLAVVAWDAKRIDVNFDVVAKAWDSAINRFVMKYKLPSSGYLMHGAFEAARYAQRLAVRRPERFLAVHMHLPCGFDDPTERGASPLWCITTGESDFEYADSRKFFRAARDLRYPIIYKAYPGAGNEYNDRASDLGLACFDYALKERMHAFLVNEGKSSELDWRDIFSSAPYVADIFNQAFYSKFEYSVIPLEFRMLVPSKPICEAWLRE